MLKKLNKIQRKIDSIEKRNSIHKKSKLTKIYHILKIHKKNPHIKNHIKKYKHIYRRTKKR